MLALERNTIPPRTGIDLQQNPTKIQGWLKNTHTITSTSSSSSCRDKGSILICTQCFSRKDVAPSSWLWKPLRLGNNLEQSASLTTHF